MNREEWLGSLLEALRPTFAAADKALPERIRVSCGWPSSRALSKKQRRIGECWSVRASDDGTHEILVSPSLADPAEIAHVLVHELCHAACGTDCGHKGEFVRLARKLGLEGKPTATVAGKDLADRLNALTGKLPAYPHARLDAAHRPVKKQGTRMLKVECGSCGYVVRVARKWLDEGMPTCHCGNGEMEVAS